MVFDILEDKLEHEYELSASLMLRQINGEDECDTVNEHTILGKTCNIDAAQNEIIGIQDTLVNSEQSVILEELSDYKIGIDDILDKEYRLIEVGRNSNEYKFVSELFHQTMDCTRSKIVKLERLQNPALHQYFSVKKKQMEMDLDSNPLVLNSTILSLEKYLFHGVQRSYVDIICRNNFDWRTCGVSHGIMYGQGTYFARDASYAHRYTDHQPKAAIELAVFDTNCELEDINLAPSSPTPINTLQQSWFENDKYSAASGQQKQNFISDFTDRKIESAVISTTKNNTDLKGDFDVDNQTLNFIKQIHKSTDNKEENNNELDCKRHVRSMFLARVLIGSYTEGRRLYRKPPPIDPTNPFGRTYHSCVNYVDDPSLFVVFDSAQYFPEYLIHYTNRPLLP